MFVENKNNYNIINHIDGNGYNNYYKNLEWCTQKNNVIHAWKNGLCENIRKKARFSKGRKPLKIIQINEKGEIIKEFNSVKEASKILNITEAQARSSIYRKSKKYNLRKREDYYD